MKEGVIGFIGFALGLVLGVSAKVTLVALQSEEAVVAVGPTDGKEAIKERAMEKLKKRRNE